jgi:hypothetical protein
MSDYLDSLLARSTNPQEMVQPRPMSLFEPLPGTAWLPAGHLPAPEEGEGEPVSGDWTLGALETAQPAGRHPPSAPLVTGPDVEQRYPGILPTRADLRAGPPAPQRPPALAMYRSDRTKAEPPRIQPGPSLTQPNPFPASGTRVQPESARMTEPGSPRSGVGQAVPATAATRAAGGDAPQVAVERVAQPALESAVEHTVLERIIRQAAPPDRFTESDRRVVAKAATAQPDPAVPLPVVARPQVRPYPEPELSSAAEPAAKPEPTIQVTIGRIEVRATSAASPPRKQMPTAPMLSLEDYLRQRNGGAR